MLGYNFTAAGFAAAKLTGLDGLTVVSEKTPVHFECGAFACGADTFTLTGMVKDR